mgnify:CR=1 FL=1
MSPLILSNFIVKSESVKQNCQFSFPQRWQSCFFLPHCYQMFSTKCTTINSTKVWYYTIILMFLHHVNIFIFILLCYMYLTMLFLLCYFYMKQRDFCYNIMCVQLSHLYIIIKTPWRVMILCTDNSDVKCCFTGASWQEPIYHQY